MPQGQQAQGQQTTPKKNLTIGRTGGYSVTLEGTQDRQFYLRPPFQIRRGSSNIPAPVTGFKFESNRFFISINASSSKVVERVGIDGSYYGVETSSLSEGSRTYPIITSLTPTRANQTFSVKVEFADGTEISQGVETYSPTHIFIGTKPIQKVYLGKATSPNIWQQSGAVFSNFFDSNGNIVDSSSPSFHIRSRPQSGSGGIFPNNPAYYQVQIYTARFNKTLSNLVINGNTYNPTNLSLDGSIKAVGPVASADRITSRTTTFTSFVLNFTDRTSITLKLRDDSVLLWENSTPPVITSFTATPTSFDLDNPTPANLQLSFSIASGTTQARIYREPQGTQVGVEYDSSNIVNSATVTTPRPTQNQIYRLVARNTGGASHQDLTVTVTQDAKLERFRRTSFRQVPSVQAGTFYFEAYVTGYPQPALTYAFGNGNRGTITARHFVPIQGVANQWIVQWSVYHTVLNDSLVLTATNSSNSVTATITNISA